MTKEILIEEDFRKLSFLSKLQEKMDYSNIDLENLDFNRLTADDIKFHPEKAKILRERKIWLKENRRKINKTMSESELFNYFFGEAGENFIKEFKEMEQVKNRKYREKPENKKKIYLSRKKYYENNREEIKRRAKIYNALTRVKEHRKKYQQLPETIKRRRAADKKRREKKYIYKPNPTDINNEK